MRAVCFYVTFENFSGTVGSFLHVKPWTQFFDLKGREDIPMSYADHITMKNSTCKCGCFFDVKADETQYQLSNILIENVTARAKEKGITDDNQKGVTFNNVTVTAWE